VFDSKAFYGGVLTELVMKRLVEWEGKLECPEAEDMVYFHNQFWHSAEERKQPKTALRTESLLGQDCKKEYSNSKAEVPTLWHRDPV
jgi:hypothetical protein